jgi:diguanylate cyclase (GGDEF)-like protein/PAS domain S-box-containing protein
MKNKNSQYLQGIVNVFDQSEDMHMLTDCAGVIVYVNPAFESATGFSKDEVTGKTPAMFESGAHPGDFYAAILDMLKTGKVFKGVLVNRKRNGEILHMETTANPIRDKLGNITHFFATGRDVTKNARELEQLQHLANFDSLTGLPNRNLFMDRLQQALSHTDRERQQVALVYLDMDGFKQVNDLHGHASGDELLQAVASRLKSCVRQGDTVARLCGDEFAMILVNTNGIESVQKILKKIIDSFNQSPLLGDRYMNGSCSIGVSIYPRDGEAVSELLRCADIAMYRTKARGGNGYSFYSEQNESNAGLSARSDMAMIQQDILHEKIEDSHAQGTFMPYVDPGFLVKINRDRGKIL